MKIQRKDFLAMEHGEALSLRKWLDGQGSAYHYRGARNTRAGRWGSNAWERAAGRRESWMGFEEKHEKTRIGFVWQTHVSLLTAVNTEWPGSKYRTSMSSPPRACHSYPDPLLATGSA